MVHFYHEPPDPRKAMRYESAIQKKIKQTSYHTHSMSPSIHAKPCDRRVPTTTKQLNKLINKQTSTQTTKREKRGCDAETAFMKRYIPQTNVFRRQICPFSLFSQEGVKNSQITNYGQTTSNDISFNNESRCMGRLMSQSMGHKNSRQQMLLIHYASKS